MENPNPRDDESTDEEEEEELINPNMKPYDRSQTVQFTGNEESSSYELNSRDVTIIPSSGEHETGSSKIKMKNVVDFNWEFKYYPGQLLAIHVSGKYLAYAIKTVGKMGGVVRVVSRESGNRTLLKKMVGMVQDIGFAHVANQVILASVDDTGTLCVHRVEEKTYNTISCSILLQVEQGASPVGGACHRIFWCPYTPDVDESRAPSDVDAGKLLCLTQGNRARLINVGMINERFGADPINPSDLEGEPGYLEIASHTQPVIDASFAPDGSAIATASQDGYVKFFQVDVYHKSPIRCLHEWKPHGDKPLSALVFVDNHKTFEPHPDVQFWKFLITGAENNSELKFWSCESWTCLQTIRFAPARPSRKVVLKVGLDLGADYMLVSDIHGKLLYVLQLRKYPAPWQKVAYVRSVTELPLPCPILSFAILDAGMRSFKSPSLEDLANEEGEDDVGQYIQALVVRMYLVQPKSLQECNLAFQPPCLDDQDLQLDTITHDSIMFVDHLSDLSSLVNQSRADESLSELPLRPELTLLGPNAFTSPGKDSPSPGLSSPQLPARILDGGLSSSPTPGLSPTLRGVDPLDAAPGLPLATSEQFQRSEGFASGGSSPSREVREIFSLGGPDRDPYYEDKAITDVEAAVAELTEGGVEFVDANEGFSDAVEMRSAASEPADPLRVFLNPDVGAVGSPQSNIYDVDIIDESKSELKDVLLGLHLIPTPPTSSVLLEPAQTNGLLQAAPDSAGWPPIPLALVNEARHSATDAKRRSVGGDKSGVKVYLAPIKRSLTKEKLRELVVFDALSPKSIYINREETPGSKSTWAILEYDNPRDAEAAIQELHNKAPHHWMAKLAHHTSPHNAHIEDSIMATPPHTPELRPSVSSRLEGVGAGDPMSEALNDRISSLVQIVEQQSAAIQGLTTEIVSLRRQVSERDKTRDKSLLGQVDKLMGRNRDEAAVRWQEWLVARSDLDRARHEEALLHAAQRLPTLVHDEVSATLLPQLSKAILKVVEPMQAKLHQDMTHQLTVIDHQLKSHIAQLVQGKAVTDILSQSAAVAMKPASQACFTEVYTQSIMPRFEKACNLMFKQVNDTFAKGTHEFVETLEGHVKKQQLQHDKTQQLMGQLQTVAEGTRAGSEQVHKGLAGLQEGLARCVRDSVREHLARGFQRQQAAIETRVLEAVRCITPAPHVVDAQTQILQLIASEDINAAFQMALSAADLGLVVLVCEKVDPESLFSQSPCPLQQNVLLSLIQQLSADMLNHTDTKHKYLLEAVMNLDTRNPETRGHIPAVIQRLQQQLKEYMASSSNPKMVNKVKQLLFSTKALLNFNST